MIDCPNAEMRDRLPDLVHGQLGVRDAAEVAAHATACAACAAELALLRELRTAMRAAPRVDVARIVKALPAPSTGTGSGGGRVQRPTSTRLDWRIAAGILLIAAAAGSAVVLGPPEADRERRDASVAASEDGQGRSGAASVATQEVAAADLSIDADLRDATVGELEELLEALESFDGLPAGEPEPSPTVDGSGAELQQ